MARVVVAGYMVRHPLAGNMMAYFQYVLGLRRLGHEVMYVEDSGWPSSSYDPEAGEMQTFPTTGLRLVRQLVSQYCPEVPVVYVDIESGRTDGMEWSTLRDRLQASDLLINVGGVCWLPELLLCRRRAFVDMDPFCTQIGMFGSHILNDYDVHFTYGTNIGKPECPVPDAGIEWRPLLPPVVPDLWPVTRPPRGAPLTTLSSWRRLEPLVYEGEQYGMKDEEFLRMLDLPSRVQNGVSLAVALGAPKEIWRRFSEAGWRLFDTGPVSRDLDGYRSFISSSRAELSPATSYNVRLRTGWFSDRSACYLASGRPVILQDTGYGESLPTGEGLLPFLSVDDAADRIQQTNADYLRHSAAARRLATDHLSFDVVLPKIIEAASERPTVVKGASP